MISKESGRPETIYCNTWKPKDLEHELLLTDFCLGYPTAQFTRGYIVNRKLKPDAEMRLDGEFFFVELDTGEQSVSRQVAKRQKVYEGCTEFVLYVCQSRRRLENLRKNASEWVRQIALFSTLEEVQRSPRGDIWIDHYGECTSI